MVQIWYVDIRDQQHNCDTFHRNYLCNSGNEIGGEVSVFQRLEAEECWDGEKSASKDTATEDRGCNAYQHPSNERVGGLLD